MKKLFFCVLFSVIIVLPAFADHYPRNPKIDIQHYTFKITLSDSTNVIIGKTGVEVKFKTNGLEKFALDLVEKDSPSSETGMTVHSITVNGQEVKYQQANNRLIIHLNSPSKKDEIRTYEISYSGIPADGLIISKNKYGQRTFFGDNWPNRAHYWLPVIDHPYDKATCDFIVTAPAKYQVIANGSLVEETDLKNGLKLTHWKESEPLPTKVMVIGVARFAVQYLKKFDCIPIETWVYPQDREKGFYDFEPAEKIIRLFTKLIGPFPYEKLADVESKTIYGGMENASNIFYSEQEITGTRRSEVTIAHEIAHQWFGDAVSEESWDQIWLSEGFATFFQNYFTGYEFGQDSLISALKKERRLVIEYDSINPNSPVVDNSIINLKDLLNINSYQKGAWVLRMLRHVLGDKIFWEGIRLYYKTYRNGNALTKNFEQVMEKVSGKNLSWFFNEWLYKPGLPYLEGKWNYNREKKILTLRLDQVQTYNNIFTMPLDVAVYYHGKSKPEIERININKKDNIFNLKVNGTPDKVVLDPGIWFLMKAELEKQ